MINLHIENEQIIIEENNQEWFLIDGKFYCEGELITDLTTIKALKKDLAEAIEFLRIEVVK